MKDAKIIIIFLIVMSFSLFAAGCSNTMKIAGEEIPIDQQSFDLRHLEMTTAEHDALAERAPESDILWNVPIGALRVESDTIELTLPSLSSDEVAALAYLPMLKSVTITSDQDFNAIQQAISAYPLCEFTWETTVSGVAVSSTDQSLDLSGMLVDLNELNTALAKLPNLKTLNLYDSCVRIEDIAAIRENYPSLSVKGGINLFGNAMDFDATTADLSGTTLDLASLTHALEQLPNLKEVALTGCALTDDEKRELVASFPDLFFLWEVELPIGISVSSDITELDLRGYKIEDTVALAEQLKLLQKLTFLDMSYCGPSNEQMAALQEALPNVKVVWMLHFVYWELRTDVKAFSMGWRSRTRFPDGKGWYTNVGQSFTYKKINDQTIQELKYCKDLIALDMGHSDVYDLTTIGTLINLEYLVIALQDVRDISPLVNLQKLKYLEAFYNELDDDDLTIFLEMKSLRYLNVGGNNIHSIEILKQLTWLDRLWVNLAFLDEDQVKELKAELPNTEVHAFPWKDPGGDGWPFDNPGYTEMRNLFGFSY